MKRHDLFLPLRTLLLIFLPILFSISSFAQKGRSVSGEFAELKNARLKLIGHGAFKDAFISETTADSSGNFILDYPKEYSGIALLQSDGGFDLAVLLNSESLEIKCSDLQDFASLHFKDSPENDALYKGMALHQEAIAKLSGLQYLKKFYRKQRLGLINKEIYVQEKRLAQFSDKLPKDSHSAYYLNLYSLLSNLKAQFNSDSGRLADLETQFNTLNFNDPRLSSSGLFSPILNSYFQLLENNYTIDEVYSHATASIHLILKSMSANPELQQETSEYLFHFLKNSKIAAETAHLALQIPMKSNYQLNAKWKP